MSRKQETMASRLAAVHDKVGRLCRKLLSADEQQALEMAGTLASRNQDAVILSVLREEFGFEPEALRRFYVRVTQRAKRACETVGTFMEAPEVLLLRADGIELSEWEKEVG